MDDYDCLILLNKMFSEIVLHIELIIWHLSQCNAFMVLLLTSLILYFIMSSACKYVCVDFIQTFKKYSNIRCMLYLIEKYRFCIRGISMWYI